MEPTIYKPGAYKSPGVYNGAGGIYKGFGLYNDGTGGGGGGVDDDFFLLTYFENEDNKPKCYKGECNTSFSNFQNLGVINTDWGNVPFSKCENNNNNNNALIFNTIDGISEYLDDGGRVQVDIIYKLNSYQMYWFVEWFFSQTLFQFESNLKKIDFVIRSNSYLNKVLYNGAVDSNYDYNIGDTLGNYFTKAISKAYDGYKYLSSIIDIQNKLISFFVNGEIFCKVELSDFWINYYKNRNKKRFCISLYSGCEVSQFSVKKTQLDGLNNFTPEIYREF